jgi:UDP-N-acetylmuramoyl-tripeptide--D-alanyl-D-alanine ligase
MISALPKGLPPEAAFSGVSIDSRTVNEGDLFIAIRGERHEGHGFVTEALRKGAVAAVVEQQWLTRQRRRAVRGQPFIVVPDTVEALQALARYHRRRLGIPVLGVTGSNGKTTTKEMIASVLGTRYRVLRSESSFNNHIGVPLSLLRLRRAHEVAVVEMGMNHAGEIAHLCTIAVPTSGVITNVGPAHLEFMGDVDAVARAKGELAESIGRGGFLALNADDERVMALGESTEARVVTFGMEKGAEVRGKLLEPTDGAFWAFHYNDNPPIQLKMAGLHNVSNALAAAAVGEVMGCSPEQVKQGLEAYRGEKCRSELVRAGEILVLNDAYNSNPVSATKALELLHDWKNGRPHRRIAVLGDMLELGEQAADLHGQLGGQAYASGVDMLLAVGGFAADLTDGAISAGMRGNRVYLSDDVAGAWEVLRQLLLPGDLVLLKGSRRVGLEGLVGRIRELAPPAGGKEE